jgi:hypothetical protein
VTRNAEAAEDAAKSALILAQMVNEIEARLRMVSLLPKLCAGHFSDRQRSDWRSGTRSKLNMPRQKVSNGRARREDCARRRNRANERRGGRELA